MSNSARARCHDSAPSLSGAGRAAPTPGRPSFGRQPLFAFCPLVWALFPAASGISLAAFLAGEIGLGLVIFAAHQIAAWLAFRRTPPWRWRQWLLFGGIEVATIAFCAPSLLPWVLLPVGPAWLLRRADRRGAPLPAIPVLRIFSVAALAAIAMQSIALGLDSPLLVAVIIASFFAVLALERLVKTADLFYPANSSHLSHLAAEGDRHRSNR